MYEGSPVKVDQNPAASLQHLPPNELIHLIRKLRWIGMEGEAKNNAGAACSLSCFAWRQRDQRPDRR